MNTIIMICFLCIIIYIFQKSKSTPMIYNYSFNDESIKELFTSTETYKHYDTYNYKKYLDCLKKFNKHLEYISKELSVQNPTLTQKIHNSLERCISLLRQFINHCQQISYSIKNLSEFKELNTNCEKIYKYYYEKLHMYIQLYNQLFYEKPINTYRKAILLQGMGHAFGDQNPWKTDPLGDK